MKVVLRQRQAHCPPVKVVRVKVCDVFGRFGRVISLDQRVVCSCVPFAQRRDSAPHPPLDEQVHVQVRQQLQLYASLHQERVPAQSWRAVVVRRVQPVFFLAHLPEVLEHVCQQQNVCCHVQVVVVAHRPAAECRPDFLRVLVLFVCDAFPAQTRVELFFLGELGFIKPFKRVHALVRVDAFLQQQPLLVVICECSLHYRKLVASLHQLVQAALHEIHAVDESHISQRERDVLFRVCWYAINFAIHP